MSDLQQQLHAAISVADDLHPSDEMAAVMDCVAGSLDTFHDNDDYLRESLDQSLQFLRVQISEPDADVLIDDVERIIRQPVT